MPRKTAVATGNSKVEKVIGLLREMTQLELSALLKRLHDELDLPIPPIVQTPPTQAPTPPTDGQESPSYHHLNMGVDRLNTSKILVIRALRNHFVEMGLKEAKDMVETAENFQVEVGEGLPSEELIQLSRELVGAGAKVKLV